MIYKIRPIDPGSEAEILLVAQRMRATLVGVLGEEVGGSMYSIDWLVQRAKFHLDPQQCIGEIMLAESEQGEILGHTILRLEPDFDYVKENPVDPFEQFPDRKFGLFSTFYVAFEHRKHGIGTQFVESGEQWMRSKGMSRFRTYTAHDNFPLHRLVSNHGYALEFTKDDMVSFCKTEKEEPQPIR